MLRSKLVLFAAIVAMAFASLPSSAAEPQHRTQPATPTAGVHASAPRPAPESLASGIPLAQVLRPDEIRTRIDRLRQSLSQTGDRLADVEARLDAAQAAVARHQRAVDEAQATQERINDSLATYAALLYRLGATSDLEMIFSSEDPAEVIQRMAYLRQFRSGEQVLFEEAESVSLRGERETERLRAAAAEADAARRELAQRRNQLSRQLAEYETLQRYLEQAAGRTVYRSSRSGPGGLACPVAGPHTISNNFGAPRPGGPHQGVDIQARHGTPVVAVLPAVVVDTPSGGWIGIGVVIRDLTGTEWLYAHMSSRTVSRGERVVPGQIVGRVGCTGRCFGPHLHFEWHPAGGAPRDPYRLIRQVC